MNSYEHIAHVVGRMRSFFEAADCVLGASTDGSTSRGYGCAADVADGATEEQFDRGRANKVLQPEG